MDDVANAVENADNMRTNEKLNLVKKTGKDDMSCFVKKNLNKEKIEFTMRD
jgi:hypothetical protein